MEENNNQLIFALDAPIESLIPKMIGFNNSELMAQAKDISNYYRNMVYSEEQIPQAKTDRAKLNNLIKAIDGERLNIKKIYNAPYEEFKSKVDAVLASLKDASDTIGGQLADYEFERTKLKQIEIEKYYADTIGDLKEFVSLDKIFDDKWLNASKSLKSVKSEIDDKLTQIRGDIAAIEALASTDGTKLKVYFFRTLNLAATIAENERIKAEEERIKVAQEKQAEIAAQNTQEASQKAEEPIKETIQPKPAPEQLYDVTLEFIDLTREQAISLMDYVKSNALPYKRIK